MKKYKITHDPTWWEFEVEIDHSKADPHIKEMVEFWMEWQISLKENDDCYTKTFLKKLGRKLSVLCFHSWDPVADLENGKEEGWTIGEKYGIKITFCDDCGIHEEQFSTQEMEVKS